MLACTITKYKFIIPAENINGCTRNLALALLYMKSRFKDYQKIMQNLFKSVYGAVKRKITIFLKLDVFEKFVKSSHK